MRQDYSQHWQLFGYDVRDLGRNWISAWRDLLWSHDSPLRSRLDEVVALRASSATVYFQAGKQCIDPVDSDCLAVLVSEDFVLSKHIPIPVQAESELDSLLELEVRASSPFTPEDTRWGWAVSSRADSTIHVVLAIASASSVMTYLGREYDSHDSHAQEVWCEIAGVMVVLQGFGEGLRARRYTKRLQRCGLLIAVLAAFVLSMGATAAFFKKAELDSMNRLLVQTQATAGEASKLRSLLAVANETIGAANEVVAAYPNPHHEIARLTELLDDDVHILSFSMSGSDIKIRGRANNAAEVMARLTDESIYRSVMAPQAFVRVGDSDEQFHLNILVGPGAE